MSMSCEHTHTSMREREGETGKEGREGRKRRWVWGGGGGRRMKNKKKPVMRRSQCFIPESHSS